MSEQKIKKDEYQKALTGYSQAIKEFRKGDFEKAAELFSSLIESFGEEKEIADRAQTYLKIIKGSAKKDSLSLKNIEDYLFYATVKINQSDFQTAVKTLEKALELKENEGHIYYLLSIAYCLSGESELGLDLLKKAIQKDRTFSVMAQNEPDFEPLYEDKKFKLITRVL